MARMLGTRGPTQQPAAPTPHAPASGLAFVPSGTIAVVFHEPQASGAIRIALGDTPSLRIAHAGGPATYVLTTEGVTVNNPGSGASYDITIPRSLARAEVRVGARLVFLKDGTQVVTLALRDTAGVYVIPFVPIGRSVP